MQFRNFALSALLVGALVTVPTVAQAEQARQAAVSKLSLRAAQVRKGAAISGKNDIRGGSVILLGVFVLAGFGIGLAVSGGGKSASP